MNNLQNRMCESFKCHECPICMSELSGDRNRVTTECGHQFHTKCLLSNVAYNGFGCPYCRSEMVEESVALQQHEYHDEDDDEEDDEDDDGVDDFNSDQEESDNLRGFRFILQRITGEILTDELDNLEEDAYENELILRSKPKPSVNLIIKKLSDEGFTLEKFVKAFLFLNDIHQEYDEYDDLNEEIFNKIRDIIENYTIEQEQEFVEKEEESEEITGKPISQIVSDLMINNVENYNFYFLENEFIDKCKQNTKNFILEEQFNYYDYSLEEKFINSIIDYVF